MGREDAGGAGGEEMTYRKLAEDCIGSASDGRMTHIFATPFFWLFKALVYAILSLKFDEDSKQS